MIAVDYLEIFPLIMEVKKRIHMLLKNKQTSIRQKEKGKRVLVKVENIMLTTKTDMISLANVKSLTFNNTTVYIG